MNTAAAIQNPRDVRRKLGLNQQIFQDAFVKKGGVQ